MRKIFILLIVLIPFLVSNSQDYKTRSDFSSDESYGEYVKKTLKIGMRVRLNQKDDKTPEGSYGIYYGTNNGNPPCLVAWDKDQGTSGYKMTDDYPRYLESHANWVEWHMIDIPEKKDPDLMSYMKRKLSEGVRVRAIMDYDNVIKRGMMGTYYGYNTSNPPVLIAWDKDVGKNVTKLDNYPEDKEKNGYWIYWNMFEVIDYDKDDYAIFNEDNLTIGTRVRANQDYGKVKSGMEGTFYGSLDPLKPPCCVMWDEDLSSSSTVSDDYPSYNHSHCYNMEWQMVDIIGKIKDGKKGGSKDYIFADEFSKDSYQWSSTSLGKETSYSVSGGELKLKHGKDGYGIITSTKSFSLPKNWEIETEIDNDGGGLNGILFGRKGDKFYLFGINRSGEYLVTKNINGKFDKTITGWTKDEVIKTSGKNVLKVQKDESAYKFYINSKLLYTSYEDLSFGDGVGLSVCADDNSMDVNYFRIKGAGGSVSTVVKTDPAPEKEETFAVGLPPILSISDITFSESVLDAEETAELSVSLKNSGPGDAKDVYVNLSGYLKDLSFPSKTYFPVIPANGGSKSVNIKIKGGLDLPTSTASLKIEVVEPNFKVRIQGKQLKFATREYRKPELILAKYAVVENQSASPNNQIDINEMIDLKFAVQNVGQGDAENVDVEVTCNQKGVMLLGVAKGQQLLRENPKYSKIGSGKFETVIYRYFVNSEFRDTQLRFSINTTERLGKHGFSESKTFAINKTLEEAGYIRTVDKTDERDLPSEVIIEDIPDFVSDVDTDIPDVGISNDNTFALVIGNENYTKEIKVKYALNDARIFKQYLEKTLGLPAKNINYLENATYGEMLDGLNWINDVIKAYNGEAKAVFYYAGHGMPDESSKKAYLLPVDGNSQNTVTAVKLTEVYSQLTEHASQSVSVFLDACFSGSARSDEGMMLADGRGVKIKVNKDALKGRIVVFSAASGDETAFPYKEKQHGMFTYFLLKKLKDTKGNVTMSELGDYIKNNVTRESVVVNRKSQTPTVNSSMDVYSEWKNWKLK